MEPYLICAEPTAEPPRAHSSARSVCSILLQSNSPPAANGVCIPVLMDGGKEAPRDLNASPTKTHGDDVRKRSVLRQIISVRAGELA